MFLTYRSGSYEISEADGVSRGTKVIIHLKPEDRTYSLKTTVEGWYFFLLVLIFFLYLITHDLFTCLIFSSIFFYSITKSYFFVFKFITILTYIKGHLYDFSFKCILDIIRRYSNFVGFPIYLNGARLNNIEVCFYMSFNCSLDLMYKNGISEHVSV